MKERNKVITLLAPLGLKHTQTPGDGTVRFEKQSPNSFIEASIDCDNPQASLIKVKANASSTHTVELSLADLPKLTKMLYIKPQDMEFDAFMDVSATLSNVYERLREISPFKGSMKA